MQENRPVQQNWAMDQTGGRRRAVRKRRPYLPALVNAAGAATAVAAWVATVIAAVEFGRWAREGDGLGWLFLAIGTVGAIACLLLALVLGVRLLLSLGLLSQYRPKRARRG